MGDLNMAEIIIYNTEDGQANIKLYANDGTVWLNQAQIAKLFNTTKQNVSLHINNIFNEGELDQISVVKDYLTTAKDGKEYNVVYYNLDVILAIGFRVRSKRGTQFRKWANSSLKEYLQKGYLLDKDRLKNPDGRPDYYDELLADIRDIRASEKRFYQKVRDLFALSSDYDSQDKTVWDFYAEVQNKLLYGVTGKTGAELVMARADASKANMALTSWQGKVVRKADVIIAKNYLTADEIDSLNRLVTIFLESAEFRVKQRKMLTMQFWRNSIDKLLDDHDVPVLKTKGVYTHEQAKEFAEKSYLEFNNRRKKYEAQQADTEDIDILEAEIKDIGKK
jgi:hypothetical protein